MGVWPPADGPVLNEPPAHEVTARPEPDPREVTAFLARFASTMLTSESPLSGVEQALRSLAEFVGVDRASAYIIRRTWPYEIDHHVAVSLDGAAASPLDVPLADRVAMLEAADDDGLLVMQPGRDATAARQQMQRRGLASIRICRTFISDDRAGMVSLRSLVPRQWAAWEVQLLRAASSVVAHGLWRSFTERELWARHAALAASEQRWRSIIDNAPASIFRLDSAGRVLHANRETAAFGDIDPESLRGLCIPDLIAEPEVRADFYEKLERVFNHGERVESLVSVQTPRGQVWFEGRAVPEVADDGRVESMLLFAVDVSERRRMEAQIAIAATTDSLTGLVLRSVFIEQLRLELAAHRESGRTLAVLFIDLDRFKRTNDLFGHAVGDELLRVVGSRLRSVLRSSDIVARFGGDEFAAVLCDVGGRREVERIVEQVRSVLSESVDVGVRIVHPSASIGVAISSSDDREPDDLLRGADRAMYLAKERGRNRVEVFDEAMRHDWHARVDTERALRRSIDMGEIVVHYLPEVELESRQVVAVEALARWQHPTQGLLPAARFVGLAEESGLIASLGGRVLRDACRQLAVWTDELGDSSLMLRVNLSPRQLSLPSIVGDVRDAIANAGLDATRLQVEIPESALLGDLEAIRDTLRRIRQLGVSIAVDDFGSGHVSFASLEQFPIETLKIDRSFMAGLGSRRRDTAIVGALVGLGHALGLELVAEGVETETQAGVLRSLGCQRAQGHLFAPAMAPSDMRRVLGSPAGH